MNYLKNEFYKLSGQMNLKKINYSGQQSVKTFWAPCLALFDEGPATPGGGGAGVFSSGD